MKTVTRVVYVASECRLVGISFALHLTGGAVITRCEQGGNAAVVVEGGVSVAVRGECGDVKPFHCCHRSSRSLQIVTLRARRMGADDWLLTIERGKHRQFAKRQTVVHCQAHTELHPVPTHCQSLHSSEMPYHQVNRVIVVALLVSLSEEGLARILRSNYAGSQPLPTSEIVA